MPKFLAKNRRYKEEICFKCTGQIIVKYNIGTNDYSKKNNWEYWTENKENKGKYICNLCLMNMYYNNPKVYLTEIKSAQRKQTISSYIYQGVIK